MGKTSKTVPTNGRREIQAAEMRLKSQHQRNNSKSSQSAPGPPRNNPNSTIFPILDSTSSKVKRAQNARRASRKQLALSAARSVIAQHISNPEQQQEALNRVEHKMNDIKMDPKLQGFKNTQNAMDKRNRVRNGPVAVKPGFFNQTQKTQNTQMINLMAIKKNLKAGLDEKDKKIVALEQKIVDLQQELDYVTETREIHYEYKINHLADELRKYVELLKEQVGLELKALLGSADVNEIMNYRRQAMQQIHSSYSGQWKKNIIAIRNELKTQIDTFKVKSLGMHFKIKALETKYKQDLATAINQFKLEHENVPYHL